MLARREDIDVLFVDYDAVISDPEGEARRIADFIGDGLDVKKMHEAVHKAVHAVMQRRVGLLAETKWRNRSSNMPSASREDLGA